jgi:hypothetical protein
VRKLPEKSKKFSIEKIKIQNVRPSKTSDSLIEEPEE